MGDIISRAVSFELRDHSNDGNTFTGYAAVFGVPTLIHERNESFMEQVARGAFAKTVNNMDKIRFQFDHGQHPLIGSIPLGKITHLEEDARGLYVEAQLSDNWLIQPIRDAIRDGAIDGMSFRFGVEAEEWDRSGDVAMRTLLDLRVPELGPVVFPAYSATSAAVRSAFSVIPAEIRAALDESDTPATPDEGQPTETPDEGHRTRTRNQRRAIAAAAISKENHNG